MSIKDGRDYLYLIWKENKNRRQFIVGQLSKNGQYEFNYGFEVNEAIKNGFNLLVSFEDVSKIYKSDVLFPVFSSRLPDKKRRGIEEILAKFELDTYDEYKLLKRSGAKLPIDNLQFIDPILNEEMTVKRIFYLAGPRHYIGCVDKDCENAIDIKNGETLIIKREPENEYDEYAIQVVLNGTNIGYIPRYYSAEVCHLLDAGFKYECTVKGVSKTGNCDECITIELDLQK